MVHSGVSAVVTNWNRADSLPACLRSILAQRDVDVEIIIVDDASTDNSLEVIKRYKKAYPETIRAFETHESVTQNICLPANIGFKRARHPYVVVNPSDILHILPTNFKKFLEVIGRDEKAFACPSSVNLADLKWKEICPAGCVKTEWIRAIGGFDERMKGWGANEPDLFMRLQMIGVRAVKADALVMHVDRILGEVRSTRKYNPENDRIHAENVRNNMAKPNAEWGEHPFLEEIT